VCYSELFVAVANYFKLTCAIPNDSSPWAAVLSQCALFQLCSSFWAGILSQFALFLTIYRCGRLFLANVRYSQRLLASGNYSYRMCAILGDSSPWAAILNPCALLLNICSCSIFVAVVHSWPTCAVFNDLWLWATGLS
jgi:hypothetical protein